MSAATLAAGRRVPDHLLAAIKDVVGPRGWTDTADGMAPHLTDWRGVYRGAAALVVRPATTAEVAAVVRRCADALVPVVPQGGNTGLMGGATPFEHGGEILLSLARLNRIRDIDALNYTVTAEAGCILKQVQAAADGVDRLFPLSLSAEGSCQIGGNLSTNAGGMAVLRYGNMRDMVLGLEVVLPDGRIWDGLRRLRKDNTGYDLKQLFVGAEGTLGIVTAAVLKLFPRPGERVTAFAAIRDLPAGIELLARCRTATGDAVTGFELIPRIAIDLAHRHVPGSAEPLSGRHDYCVLIAVSAPTIATGLRSAVEQTLGEAIAEGLVPDATIAEGENQAARLWHIRETIVEAQRLDGAHVKHDVSVPLTAIPEFIGLATEAVKRTVPGIRIVPFGHIGDGNIHFNLLRPEGSDTEAFLQCGPELNRLVHDIAAALGGSISAEHGIGRLKREEIRRYKSAVELELMQRIKAALDPDNIMNPGKVV